MVETDKYLRAMTLPARHKWSITIMLITFFTESLIYTNHNCKLSEVSGFFKPGLHEPQLQVEWSVSHVSLSLVYTNQDAADLERAAVSFDYNRRN